MITVAEIEPFQRKVEKLLSSEERQDFISYLSEHPSSGDLIQGTVGIRVVYYFHSEIMPLYLLAAFGENEKANISAEEKHLLSKSVKALVAFWRKRNGSSIH